MKALPGKELLVTWGAFKYAQLWQAKPFAEVERFDFSSNVLDVGIIGPQELVFVCETETVYVNIETNKVASRVQRPAGETIVEATISPKCRYLASVPSYNRRQIKITELATGRRISEFKRHLGSLGITFMCFSRDESRLVSGCSALPGGASTVFESDVSTGALNYQYDFGSKAITQCAISPDGSLIALGGGTHRDIYLYKTVSHELITVLKGHTNVVSALTFSDDGAFLMSGSYDKTAKIWNIASDVLQCTVGPFEQHVVGLVSFNGKKGFAYDLSNTISVFEISSSGQTLPSRTSSATAEIADVCLDEYKQVMAVACQSGVLVWDLAGQRQYMIEPSSGDHGPHLVDVLQNGSLLTTVWGDRVDVHNIDDGKLQRTIKFSSLGVFKGKEQADPENIGMIQRCARPGLYYSFDGRFLGSIDAVNGLTKNYSLKAVTSEGGYDPNTALWADSVSSSFRFIWSNGPLHSAVRRAVEKNGEMIFVRGFPEWVTGVASAPNEKQVALYSQGWIWMVDGETGSIANKIDVGWLENKSGKDKQIRFLSDAKRIACWNRDGTVSIWDSEKGTKLRTLGTNAYPAVAWNISSNERYILIAYAENAGIIEVWNLEDGKLLFNMLVDRDGSWTASDKAHQFDAGNLDHVSGHWVFSDDPSRALGPEVLMRDYYEPRLVHRLLAGEELPKVRPLGDLNRVQPGVKIVSLKQGTQPDLADVTVEVSPAEGAFQRDGKVVKITTDVYDLRLFRGGQLVGQEPELSAEAEAGLKNGVVLSVEELNEWKAVRQVNPVTGRVSLDPATGKLQRTFTVRLPHGQAGKEIEFTAYAFNEDRVKSATDPTRYKLPLDVGPVKRRAYVVTMGVNAYENPGWDLRFAASDAKRMQDALSSRLEKQQYEVVPVTLVSDRKQAGGLKDGIREFGEDHATKAGLHAVLELLAGHALSEELKKNLPPGAEKIGKAEPDDLVVLSVSSHGYTSKEGMFYILPSDSGETDGHGLTEELRRKWISSDELSAWLRDVDAGDLVMIVDTCHSASTVEEPGFKPGPMGSRGLGQLAYDKGMRILAASQADDIALESEKLKQGLLTYALVHDGLEAKQAVKGRTNEITLESWLEYGSQRVPSLYQEVLKGKVQTFSEGAKDVQIDADLSGESSSLKKPSAFQQPSLFNFQKHEQDIQLQ